MDIPLLRYAKLINGSDMIAITKLDVLSDLDEIQVCVGYKYGGIETDIIPFNLSDVQPIYTTLPGWNQDISEARTFEDLPENARKYVEFIEQSLDVRAVLISVGAEREAIIDRIDEVAQRDEPDEVVIPLSLFQDKEALIDAIRRFDANGAGILS